MGRVKTVLHRATLGAIVTFLFAPVVVVVVMSFSNTPYLAFPPKGLGLRQFRSAFASEQWRDVTGRSLLVAGPVAVAAVASAALLVLGLQRTKLPFKEGIIGLCTLPLLVPGVAFAVALYDFFARAGLLDSFVGVILAHTVYILPIAVLVLWPAIRNISPDLELAAMTMGARRAEAWLGVTMRLLAPSLIASAIIVFLTSFDEATLVAFITGPNTTTLPKAILDSVSTGVDPTITAIATLLIFTTAALMTFAEVLRARSNRQ
jgi:ABC-type spermidine/putrescine transport system permease subunit II